MSSVEHHQTRRIADRQHAQHYLVDQRKDGGVGANAEREGKHGYQRVSGAFSQHANRVA